MRRQAVQHIFATLLALATGSVLSLVTAQYFSFDTGSVTTYPYQQGCSEELNLMVTTETDTTGAGAGLITLQFDPTTISYATGNLDTNLFIASPTTFQYYLGLPVRKDPAKTLLYIDRNNAGSNYIGSGLYGTIRFVPKYDPMAYIGNFRIIYNGSETVTSLSYMGSNTINSGHQYARLTGAYAIVQAPCVNDTAAPAYTMTPDSGTKKSHLSGVQMTLTENIGDANVPYVRTGGLPGVGTRTGNVWGINNQYGINFSTFKLFMSGNGYTRYFTGGMFSPAGTLSYATNGKTRQFEDKNYSMDIASGALFDYGIEKTIIFTGTIVDRNGNSRSINGSFNSPVSPWLIPGSRNPAAGSVGIPTPSPVILGIADDRAGVDSGSIIVTLQGIAGTTYGPYVFSGSDLNLSSIAGSALQPDYMITISNHIEFPSSGTIQVSIFAEDMAGNIDAIGDYSFTTKLSCADYGCCPNVYLQTGTNPPFFYSGFTLNISGGLNASFTGYGFTGVIDCGLGGQTALNIYKGTEELSGSAGFVGFHDLPQLIISGNTSTVKAVLSGHTLYLKKIFIPPITPPGTGGGGGGGGGGSLSVDDCTLPSSLACANNDGVNGAGIDYSTGYYDATCCAPAAHGAPSCDITDSPYDDQELNDAFQRAYGLNITNKCPITDARLEYPLIRMEAAKMMSLFTIQVIGLYPNTNKPNCDTYPDITNLSDEMKFYIKTSCQLDIMGLKPDGKTPDEVFNPYEYVDRAQFGTMLSRLIYGDVYNIYTGEETVYKRYEKHLAALNRDNIMHKIDDPFMLEQRGRVMLMFYRIVEQDLVAQYRLVAPVHNGAIVLLENLR